MTQIYMPLSPRETFEDNIRPAFLLLDIYRLLETQQIYTEGELVDRLREVVNGSPEEYLMLLYNGLFLGLVRERAQLQPSALRRATLCHLLRQAVVAASTSLDTYLPALLRENLPLVIQARGRDFIPRQDKLVQGYFQNLTFSLDETLRLLSDPDPVERISKKVLGLTNFSYLSNRNGVHVTGALLGISDPWESIAERLQRDAGELADVLRDTVRRRNDIVHRADRAQTEPGGEAQSISLSWTQQALDTLNHICMALDELVTEEMARLRNMVSAETSVPS